MTSLTTGSTARSLLLRAFLHWSEARAEDGSRSVFEGLGLAAAMYVMMLLRNIGGNQSTGALLTCAFRRLPAPRGHRTAPPAAKGMSGD